jgi:hypothetical protein
VARSLAHLAVVGVGTQNKQILRLPLAAPQHFILKLAVPPLRQVAIVGLTALL